MNLKKIVINNEEFKKQIENFGKKLVRLQVMNTSIYKKNKVFILLQNFYRYYCSFLSR